MADNIFEDWLNSAKDFKKKADAVLAEVHKAKQEMLALRNEIMDRLDEGQFIRDDKRIIISAPEIIIGNVNHFGDLQGGGTVIIKGSSTNIHGVGDNGSVKIVAPSIRQEAVNPGIDGTEAVVGAQSEIVSRARSIHVESQNPQYLKDRGGFFLTTAYSTGVHIVSDAGIEVSATNPNEKKKTAIDHELNAVNASIAQIESFVSGQQQTLEILYGTKISPSISSDKLLSKTDELGRANFAALDLISATYQDQVDLFGQIMSDLVRQTAILTELKRRKACLENAKKQLPNANDYKEKFTGSALTLNSEAVNIQNVDGDGNWRTDETSHIALIGNKVNINSFVGERGGLPDKKYKSRISLLSRNIDLMTYDVKDTTFDNNTHKLKTAKLPVEGCVSIRSKDINVDAVDMEMTDTDKFKETALTKDSQVNIRAEKVKVKTIDEKGKSVGKFTVNSQKIALKSTDIKDYKPEKELDDQGNLKQPEKMSSDKVADGSEMLLLSEKINLGRKKKELKSKHIKIGADESVYVYSNKKLKAFTGEDGSFEAGFGLEDKKVNLSSSETTITGDKVKVEGEAAFNSKVTGTDIECKNLTASSAIKAPNISDGTMIGGAAGSKTKVSVDKLEDSDL